MNPQSPISTPQSDVAPRHLGLIIDGNRRWAKANGLPTLEGHRKGIGNLKTIVAEAFNSGVKYVSVYVFSVENWNRTQEEVSYLMNLIAKTFANDTKEFIEQGVKIKVLGSEENVPKKIQKIIDSVEEDSKNNTKGTLAFCFNYSGLQEITDAVKKIIQSDTRAEDVTEETLMNSLYSPEIPAVDFMVRTSGEQRISNFMLPRMAYAELYFVDKHWPDFTKADLTAALSEFARRNRRFGGN